MPLWNVMERDRNPESAVMQDGKLLESAGRLVNIRPGHHEVVRSCYDRQLINLGVPAKFPHHEDELVWP